MNKIIIPNKCKDCSFIRHYNSGAFARNPHACCEFRWLLLKEDYKVNPEKKDENCLLLMLQENEIKFMEENEQ